MKKINQQATRIFCRLLGKMNGKEQITLTAGEFMPLSVECIEEHINTPWGIAKLISLSHSYKQNGDLMRDPEMVFIFCDYRKDEKDFDSVRIYPQMYQQDNLGLYEESVCIEKGQVTTFIKTWQQGHCGFANLWLRNIQQQGFLK